MNFLFCLELISAIHFIDSPSLTRASNLKNNGEIELIDSARIVSSMER